MSFINDVQDAQLTQEESVKIHLELLKGEIMAAAGRGETSISLHEVGEFSVPGSPCRVALLTVFEDIPKYLGPGFRDSQCYLGRSGSHMAGGDMYLRRVYWNG